MEQVRQLLQAEKFQPVRFGRGASDRDILAAESEVGVGFPASYRRFLNCLGWIESPYISVFGLGADVDSAYDVVKVTKSERHEADLSIPPNLIPIVNDGSGNLYCLDTFQMHESECPVVFWDHESFEGADQIPTVVGPDFCTWIINEINQLGV